MLRSFGLEGLQQKLRSHIDIARWLERQINDSSDFEMVIPRTMNLVCFRFVGTQANLNNANSELLDKINNTGKLYLTHTVVFDKYCLRISIGNTNVEQSHVEQAWKLINKLVTDMR